MFLKQEKLEIDDFEERKTLVLKFLTNSLAKILQNIFAYSFVSEQSIYFYFEKKIAIFGRRGGRPLSPPPPHPLRLFSYVLPKVS